MQCYIYVYSLYSDSIISHMDVRVCLCAGARELACRLLPPAVRECVIGCFGA